MSDFDKEAERERLREKYEREEEKREVTEKMSELLLKGATMTNAHCQDCGDPIFRYDGQEFCASCEKAVQRDAGGETDDGTNAGGEQSAATNGDQKEIEVASPDDTRVRFGGDTAEPTDDEPTAQEAAGGSAVDADDGTSGSPSDQPRADRSTPQPERRVTGVESGESGDLAAARASLSRTVTRLARQAEDSDDLGRQRDLLAATQEAAQALAALRDASR